MSVMSNCYNVQHLFVICFPKFKETFEIFL